MCGVHAKQAAILVLVGIVGWLAPAVARGLATESNVTNVGSISIASLSRLAPEASDLGVDLPPSFTVAGIERQFPFLGTGGLDPERPLGLFFFAGPDANVRGADGIAVVLPVKRDVATLKSFLNAGGKPLGGGSGAVELNGTFFRRTASYLIFSRTPAAAIDVREADLLDGYRPPFGSRTGPDGPLARASLDLAAFRRIDPWRFNAFVDGLSHAAAAKVPGGIVTSDALLALANRVTRLDLALVRTGDEMSLKFGVAPVRIPAGGTFPRPGMPEEVIARLDVGAPPLQVMPWLGSLFGRTGPGMRLVAGERQDDFVHNVTDVLLGGEAVSIGLEPRENNAIFYVVQQHVQHDPVARLRQLAEQSGLMAGYAADRTRTTFLDFTQYTTEAGLHVARVKVMEGKACTFCLDVLRRADAVYLTGSNDLGQYLPSLIDAKQEGQFSGLASGSLNLAAALAIVEDATGLGGMPPARREQLHRILKGRSLTVSATGEVDEAVFGLAVPRALLKDLLAAYRPSISK